MEIAYEAVTPVAADSKLDGTEKLRANGIIGYTGSDRANDGADQKSQGSQVSFLCNGSYLTPVGGARPGSDFYNRGRALACLEASPEAGWLRQLQRDVLENWTINERVTRSQTTSGSMHRCESTQIHRVSYDIPRQVHRGPERSMSTLTAVTAGTSTYEVWCTAIVSTPVRTRSACQGFGVRESQSPHGPWASGDRFFV